MTFQRASADTWQRLRTLTAAHPADVEARALLAIALQMGGAGYTGAEAKGRRLEAIDLAKTIFAAQPDHPGGAHYLIHATDHPEFAAYGLVRAGSGGASQRAQGFAFANAYNVAFAAGMMNDTAAAAALTGMFAGDGARRTIARAHIAALVARARGQGSLYLESLRAAAEADAQIVHFGPPNMVPAHELLGNALLEAKLLPDAISAFEKSLQLMPNRSASLLGLARAQRAVGDEAGARKSYARLVANWRAADATMPAVKAALDESRRSGAQ